MILYIRIRDAYMDYPKNYIAIDFETYYDSEFSLRNLSTPEYILNPLFEVIGVACSVNGARPVYGTGTQGEISSWLREFDWDNSILVAHNAPFDAAILSWVFDITPAKYYCTMMGSRPYIAPYTGRMSLASCADYLDIGKKGGYVHQASGKHRRDFSSEEMNAYGDYCIQDVALTIKLFEYETVTKDMPSDERDVIHLTVKKFVEPELLGDQATAEEALEAHMVEKEATIVAAGVPLSTLSSNGKFAKHLESQGVMPPKKISPRTGKDTFAFAKDDMDFQILMANNGEQIKKLCEGRLAAKSTQMETRLRRFIDVTKATGGQFPCALLYWAAHTGRFGGTDTTNLQNMKRGSVLRDILIAPDGHKILAADLSQIEARITATLAGEWDLVQQFANGEDIYSTFASKVYGYPVNKKDNPDERFTGKTAILGLGYSMGARRFTAEMARRGHPITPDFAQSVVTSYRSSYPRIRNLWRRFDELLKSMSLGENAQSGAVSTSQDTIWLPNGMPLIYPQLYKDTSTGNWQYTKGNESKYIYGAMLLENVVQALARIIMTNAELLLAQRGLYAQLSVHDELIYVVEEEHADVAATAINNAMSRPPSWLEKLPVATDVSSGYTYGECK